MSIHSEQYSHSHQEGVVLHTTVRTTMGRAQGLNISESGIRPVSLSIHDDGVDPYIKLRWKCKVDGWFEERFDILEEHWDPRSPITLNITTYPADPVSGQDHQEHTLSLDWEPVDCSCQHVPWTDPQAEAHGGYQLTHHRI